MTPDRPAAHGTTRLLLAVPDISCGHCKTAIEGAVGAIDGVTSVEVDIDARSVDVTLDAPEGRNAVVAAIEGQGYEVA